jgi:hypothetical protein
MKIHKLIAAAGMMALLAQAQTRAQSYVDYTGGTYFQNFDTLPYSNNLSLNTGNPITVAGTQYTFSSTAGASFDFAAPVDSSGTTAGSTGGLGLSGSMPGWYGSASVLNKYGAQPGDQTTGGVISFGGLTSGNRALGLLGTSTSGITTFALQLSNGTASAISAINLSFVGELWHQQTVANPISFGYAIEPSVSGGIPATVTNLGSFGSNFATGAKGAIDGTLAANQTNINLSAVSVGTWGAGQTLWLTWQVANSAGGAQGYAIDNLNFSAVPEPSTLVLVIGGLGAMLVIRRRR